MFKLKKPKPTCPECDGAGIVLPDPPLCPFDRDLTGYAFVEKCDICCRYPNDLEAAQAHFRTVLKTYCLNNYPHVIAKDHK